MEPYISHPPALLSAMEQCGHILFHRRKGKGGQIRILRILYRKEQENGGTPTELSQLELQNLLDIRSGSISEILGKMEASGLICKSRSESDRRKVVLTLTEKGRDEFLTAKRRREEEDTLLFECLTEEEKEQLLSLLHKLREDWQYRFGPDILKGHPDADDGGTSCSNT